MLNFVEVGDQGHAKKHISVIFEDNVFKDPSSNLYSAQTHDLNYISSTLVNFNKLKSSGTTIRNFTPLQILDNRYYINTDLKHIYSKGTGDTRFNTKSIKFLEYNTIHSILIGESIIKINNDNKSCENIGSLQQQIESNSLIVSEKYKKTLYELFECSETFRNDLELFEQHAVLGVILDKIFPNIDQILESIFKKDIKASDIKNKSYTTLFKDNDYID